jgi:uncharacterized cupin superfamily protein
MKKVNVNDVEEPGWRSPKGTFEGSSRNISLALGRDPDSSDYFKRQPFDLELLRIPPGKKPYPYHAHSNQWEFYLVISGTGLARDDDGTTRIIAGDAFLYKPGEAHQLINDSDEDMLVYVIADNPFNDHAYYPDSQKWSVKVPARRLMRSDNLDYFDGEE